MILVNDLLDGFLSWLVTNGLVSLSNTELFKETFDEGAARRNSVTIICEGGRGSGRSAVDEIRFSIIVSYYNYTDALTKAFAIYSLLNNWWDILNNDASKSGYNGYWLCDTPARFKIDDPRFQGNNFFVIQARTFAEIRG